MFSSPGANTFTSSLKNILMIKMSKYYFAGLFAKVLNILADESDLFAEFAKEFEWD